MWYMYMATVFTAETCNPQVAPFISSATSSRTANRKLPNRYYSTNCQLCIPCPCQHPYMIFLSCLNFQVQNSKQLCNVQLLSLRLDCSQMFSLCSERERLLIKNTAFSAIVTCKTCRWLTLNWVKTCPTAVSM